MLLLAFALSYAGFTAVCLAMERHYAQAFGSVPARAAVIALRTGGYSLLAVALFVCVASSPARWASSFGSAC